MHPSLCNTSTSVLRHLTLGRRNYIIIAGESESDSPQITVRSLVHLSERSIVLSIQHMLPATAFGKVVRIC